MNPKKASGQVEKGKARKQTKAFGQVGTPAAKFGRIEPENKLMLTKASGQVGRGWSHNNKKNGRAARSRNTFRQGKQQRPSGILNGSLSASLVLGPRPLGLVLTSFVQDLLKRVVVCGKRATQAALARLCVRVADAQLLRHGRLGATRQSHAGPVRRSAMSMVLAVERSDSASKQLSHMPAGLSAPAGRGRTSTLLYRTSS